MLATIFYGIARHTPEGINFKERTQKEGLEKPWLKEIKELTIGQKIN